MRETMQFQLSGELEALGNHLIKYDDVRKKTIKQDPKKPSKKSEYPLGLPPLDNLIPHDVLPYGTKRKEEIIKTISRCSPEHRYTHMSYPKVTDKYPKMGEESYLFKDTDRIVKWDGHRVKRHIMIYHYEGMWTCLWIPHTDKYVYGYSFAFKDNRSTQIKYESHPARDYSPDRKVFCRKSSGKYMTRMDKDGTKSNYFDGWSWNECEQVKIGKTAWRYKTVYVTKEMIKNGHCQDPTCGMFFARPIGDGNREKDYHISKYLEQFQKILKQSIPQWKPEYADRRGYWADRGAYRSKDNKMFDRLIRNTIGSVMKDKFMTSQKSWKYCYETDGEDNEAMIAAGNKDLIFKDTDKWDVHKLKDLLFRLNHTQCRTLYERRHNLGHVLWKEKGWIDQPFFRRLLHDAMESTETRLRHSQDQTKSFVVVEIQKLDHLIKWIETILDVWPDTPVDYFKNYQESLENVAVPWITKGGSGTGGEESLSVEMMTRHYLSRMPVKTFFEYTKKTYEEMSKTHRKDELYDRGSDSRFYNKESETMRFVMHEFNDTTSMLKDVLLRFKREGKLEKDLPSPRRWRMTEFHDHINAEQWKCKTQKEKLPQELFPKPLHIKYMDIAPNIDTWLDSVEKYSTFCLFQPQDTHQLAEWGRAARNCVGSTTYGRGIKKKEHFIVLIMINKVPRYTVQLRLSDQILRIDVGSGIKDIGNRELSREEREFVELVFNHAFTLRTKQLEEPNATKS